MNDQDMVKVPRELLERILRCAEEYVDIDNADFHELSAILAQPVADEQAEQQPVAFVNFHEMEACLHKPSSGEWIPVYTTPIAQAAPSQPDAYREMLADLQWAWCAADDHYHKPSGFYCPQCGAAKEQGHESNCELNALLAAPIAQTAPQGTNSDQYRAELYNEVWEKARSMGYGNVTGALVELERIKAAPQPCACRTPEAAATRQKDEDEAVKLQRILLDRHMDCRPADTGLMGWAAAVLSAPQQEQSGLVEALRKDAARWRLYRQGFFDPEALDASVDSALSAQGGE